MEYLYPLTIAGLSFLIRTPFAVTLPEYFQPFRAAGASPAEPDYTVWVYTNDLCPHTIRETDIVRSFALERGREIVCAEPDGREDTLYLIMPADFQERFAENANWLLYLALERPLLRRERIVLHASAVVYEGHSYLFTAPSGGGKSTQAGLWEKELHAEILNGDKVILHCVGETLIAYGSPIAGSSGIYKNLSAPVAAIVKLEKTPYNRVTELSMREAYLLLYSEAVKSGSDAQFNQYLTTVLAGYPKTVPFVRLQCLPDGSAVYAFLQYIRDHKRIL